MELNKITEQVIGAAREVHGALGPELLKPAYEECLAHGMQIREVNFKRQVPLPVDYRGVKFDCRY